MDQIYTTSLLDFFTLHFFFVFNWNNCTIHSFNLSRYLVLVFNLNPFDKQSL